MAAWVTVSLRKRQFPEPFLLGLEAPPLVRQVIGLVTYCYSVLTSLADIPTDFPPLALHILNHSLFSPSGQQAQPQLAATATWDPGWAKRLWPCTSRLIANTGKEQWERLWKAAHVQFLVHASCVSSPPLPGGEKKNLGIWLQTKKMRKSTLVVPPISCITQSNIVCYLQNEIIFLSD